MYKADVDVNKIKCICTGVNSSKAKMQLTLICVSICFFFLQTAVVNKVFDVYYKKKINKKHTLFIYHYIIYSIPSLQAFSWMLFSGNLSDTSALTLAQPFQLIAYSGELELGRDALGQLQNHDLHL